MRMRSLIAMTIQLLSPLQLQFLLMYVIFMLHTDGAWDEQHATDITQRSQAMNNDPETYYPTQSISAGSFRAESKSKVIHPFFLLFRILNNYF